MFELHTSDFDPCPGRAQLRRDGAFDGVAGTALVRGLMVHTALELLHIEHEVDIADLLVRSTEKTLDTMSDEGRMPSDAVSANMDSMVREMHNVLLQYQLRILPLTKDWTLLGCEVPVYWELREDVHLSSHLDVIFQREDGKVIFWDWKWRAAANASYSDLGRSLQLATYWAAIASGNGLFKLSGSPDLDRIQDDWYIFPECTPIGAWLDLPSLKPYSRATMGTDDEGRGTQFVKGDPRPLSRVLRYVDFKESQIEKIKEAALLRADMLIQGTAPFIPQGCSHCECEPWCPRFDIVK